VDCCVEQQGEIRLLDHFFQQNGVQNQRIAHAVSVEVFLEQFIDDAALS
jgi:hypothetical protein